MSDNDTTVKLSRRRVLGGIVTIGAASAALGAGTFAAFSDEETSEDNTIEAGTLDLELNDGSGLSYSFSGIAPGDSTTVSVDLENVGSVEASDIVVTTTTDDGGDPANLASALDIDEVRWDGTAIGASASTVQDLTSNQLELDASPVNGGAGTLEFDVTFDEDAGNDYQGVSVDIDHTFTLYQDSSQVP